MVYVGLDETQAKARPRPQLIPFAPNLTDDASLVLKAPTRLNRKLIFLFGLKWQIKKFIKIFV
jgi:hypothetical protein